MSSWLKQAENVAVTHCFIFSKEGGCVAWDEMLASGFKLTEALSFLFLEFGKQVVLPR